MAIDEKVNITATADTNQALTALQQIDASLQKIAAQGAATQAKVDSIFDRGVAGGQAFLGVLGVATTGLGLASAAFAQFNREWDNAIARQKAAADMQIGFADAQRRMANTFGGGTSIAAGTQQALGIATRTGTQPAQIALAMEQALSGKGPNLSDQAAFSAVETAAKYRPGSNAQEIGSIAQAILSMQKGDSSVSAPESMAFIRTALRAARNTDISSFSTYALPAIVQAKAFGDGSDSYQDLASMLIGVGQRADDPTSRRTATNFINFLKQIKLNTAQHLGPNASVKSQFDFLFNTEQGNKIRSKMLGPMAGGGSLDGLGDDGQMQLAESLVGAEAKMGLKSEAKTFIPLTELLQGGDNITTRLISGARRDVKDVHDPAALAEFAAAESNLNRSPYQQSAITERAFAGTESAINLDNYKAVDRERIKTFMRSAGMSDVMQRIVATGLDARVAMAKDRGEVIDAEITAVESAKLHPSGTFIGTPMGGGGSIISKELTEEQKHTNELLQVLIDKLTNQKIQLDLGDGPTERGQIQAAQRAGQ